MNFAEALAICIQNREASEVYKERLEKMSEELPSGSGFDSGTDINLIKSSIKKLVFDTSFHHMNENGYYDGWTNHAVVIEPSFGVAPFIRVSGVDKNGIKDYIADTFHYLMVKEYAWPK